ncbi:MAG: HEAT repeat domain-containing protein [Candidatus Bipolaricaulis sp.]|nr:HEAT repeat domain-containing protein [Candidatus Bipolaricaulis sp.]
MRAEIDRAIAADHIEDLVRALAEERPAGIRFAARRIVETASQDGALLARTAAWAQRPEALARQLASILCAHAYADAPDPTLDLLFSLVGDEEACVREAAAESAGQLLDAGFFPVLTRVERWRNDPSPRVRHAVLVAVGRAARRERAERAEPLLRLIAPLLKDRDPLVRRSLGPSAVATLLQHYPSLTFEHLVQWSTSNDEQVLWNVAMALASPAAADLAKKALIVLRKLSLDERRYVWRAVATAMWKLGRKRPDVVRPELARWLLDEERIAVARAALTYL